MKRIGIDGCGAVSPAGWGVEALGRALAAGAPVEPQAVARPGWASALRARRVGAPSPRPAFLGHARLRRSPPIAHFVVGAALEALGARAEAVRAQALRLGVVVCTMCGCVTYSRRFYDETLRDPATASPLLFPETVFNAPASHLAALLGTSGPGYTLVGDQGGYLAGLALAAGWLEADAVDGCVVIGAEELDWVMADAQRLFGRSAVLGEGAGALYLRTLAPGEPGVELCQVTAPELYLRRRTRTEAVRRMRAGLPAPRPDELLSDGLQDVPRLDALEAAAWSAWPGDRVSPRRVLGEAFAAAAAWQCVAAAQAVAARHHPAATVSAVGCNEQAVAARFEWRPAISGLSGEGSADTLPA